MNISKAVQIQGWMLESELEWLAEQASKHTMIAEIGSWHGRSTRALADNTEGQVYAIDTWCGTEDDQGMQKAIKDNGASWPLDEFKRNMAGCNNVHIMQMNSLQAAEKLKHLKFDMIFIDSDHSYSAVKADVLAWKPLLADRGLFCGHDYGPAPGVVKAVDELVVHHIANHTIWQQVK